MKADTPGFLPDASDVDALPAPSPLIGEGFSRNESARLELFNCSSRRESAPAFHLFRWSGLTSAAASFKRKFALERIIACLLVCLVLVPRLAGAVESSSARVLLITGIDYPGHKWRETTPVLVEALTNDARLRVDVLEDPYRLDTTDLSPYRAVFLHFMNWEKPDPNDQAKENLRGFVERGGGMVMIHFACGGFQGWPEFRNLAGRIYDRTNTHDPRGPFTVELAQTNHAITRGLAPFQVDDELYICLTGEKPVEVLATARSKVTRRDHPMAFVHSYGKGRVFQTPLGHDVKALRSGRTLDLIRRGTLWAAGLEGVAVTKPDRAEVERAFTLPTGFSIQLVAAEPDLANPMTMCVDEQGALWVTEAHTYRWGTNGSPFHPPTNPIKRIELGPDGRAARTTVAAEGFPEPVIGLCARDDQLYATCLNELFVADIARDGRLANRKLLVKDAAVPWNPFGMYRVQVGPDDKLWLCIADHPGSEPVTLTGSDGRRVRLSGRSGGMVRCNRDGSGLEVIVQGFRAPYAFDLDPWGHLWHISNGEGSPNLYVHVMPGMDYGYASRQASYAWMAGQEPLSPPVRDLGAGANTAALHYYSSQFPRDYWGNVFIANWGSHGANPANRDLRRFRRAKDGHDRAGTSDAELVEVEKFLTTTDPMFRPTGLALAPDGGLYLIDWHGRDDENDRTGRIFKISYAEPPMPKCASKPRWRRIRPLT
jgi:putative membrane-bound dehydrogenase-like protein